MNERHAIDDAIELVTSRTRQLQERVARWLEHGRRRPSATLTDAVVRHASDLEQLSREASAFDAEDDRRDGDDGPRIDSDEPDPRSTPAI